MGTIERNEKSKLKQKLPTLASRDNDIKTNVAVVVAVFVVVNQTQCNHFEPMDDNSNPHFKEPNNLTLINIWQ